MPTSAFNAAWAAYQGGQHLQALDACQRILASAPDDTEALHLIALIAQALGQQAMALDFLQRALTLCPQDPHLWNSLGNLARNEGRLQDAQQAYQTAIDRQKRYAVGWINLGATYKDLGRGPEAIACFQKAARLEPANSALYSHWGNALLSQGDVETAIARYRKALALDPQNAQAAFNLGNAFLKRGEGERAIDAYHQAIALNPAFFEPYYQLGVIHKSLKAYADALGCFEKAAALRPGEPMVALNAGGCLFELHRIEEARARFAQVTPFLQAHPLIRLRLETLVAPIAANAAAIDASRAQAASALAAFESEDLRADESTLLEYNVYPPYYWAFQGEDDRALRSRFADRMTRMLSESGWLGTESLASPSPVGPPRVAMLVSDGHEIAFNTFMGGFFRNVAPQRAQLTLVCSPASREQLLALDMDTWSVPLWTSLPAGLLQKVDVVRQSRFDALFYFEIGTDPVNYWMPLFRLAPTQCASWGFPVTSGIATVDYFLSSRLIEPPDGAAHYRERLIEFDALPVCFRRPATPPEDRVRGDLGLPPDGRLYGCLQQLVKFHPDFDPVLADILARDPQARLLIPAGDRPGLRQALENRLTQAMPPEAMARLHWLAPMPTDDFLRVMRHCDVLLDPPHLGGGNTTYEAMAMGVPVVTWPGPFMRGRITAGCYAKMGVDGPVVDSLADYAACAVSLAQDGARNRALRAEIAAASDALFEDAEAVRELEAFFIAARDRHSASG